MSKRALVPAVLIVLLISGGFLIRQKKRSIAALPPPAPAAIPVRTARVTNGSVSRRISTVAVIHADSTATIAAQIGGSLLEVPLREGDRVRTGEVVARIDARPLSDSLDVARARVAAAHQALLTQQAIFARDQVLIDGGAIARQAFDLTVAQLESARAALVAAEKQEHTAGIQLSFATVTAPFSGTITGRLIEPGELAAPGRPIYELQRPGNVRVVSRLSQQALSQLEPGSRVTFSWEGRRVSARVSRIHPALDSSFLGVVESELGSAPFNLPNGATVHADYETPAQSGLVVPDGALLDGLKGSFVVRVIHGVANPIEVEVVTRGNSTASIRGALTAGDDVVVGLPSELMTLAKGTAVIASNGGRS